MWVRVSQGAGSREQQAVWDVIKRLFCCCVVVIVIAAAYETKPSLERKQQYRRAALGQLDLEVSVLRTIYWTA